LFDLPVGETLNAHRRSCVREGRNESSEDPENMHNLRRLSPNSVELSRRRTPGKARLLVCSVAVAALLTGGLAGDRRRPLPAARPRRQKTAIADVDHGKWTLLCGADRRAFPLLTS